MKFFKKTGVILLILICVLSLCFCAKEKDNPAASDTTAQTQAPATSGDTNAPGGDVTTAATEPSTDTPSKDTEPPEKQKPDIRLDDDGKTEWDSYIPVN